MSVVVAPTAYSAHIYYWLLIPPPSSSPYTMCVVWSMAILEKTHMTSRLRRRRFETLRRIKFIHYSSHKKKRKKSEELSFMYVCVCVEEDIYLDKDKTHCSLHIVQYSVAIQIIISS